jgi:hypothetical protein
MVWNDWMILNNELERMQDEAVEPKLKHFLGGTEETYKESQSGLWVLWPRLKGARPKKKSNTLQVELVSSVIVHSLFGTQK